MLSFFFLEYIRWHLTFQKLVIVYYYRLLYGYMDSMTACISEFVSRIIWSHHNQTHKISFHKLHNNSMTILFENGLLRN